MKPIKLIAIALLITCFACNTEDKSKDNMMADNTLLKKWEGPYEGVPDFDAMNLKDLEPAMDAAIEEHLKEIDKIANVKETATFKNTIEAMERSGKNVDRVYTYYGIWSSNLSSEEFRDIQQKLSPKLSDYQSEIRQNEKLFNRIKSVYESSQKNPLEPQAQRVVDLVYKSFEMNGANLDDEGKIRYAEINKELAKLYTDFSNNILHDEENYVTFLNENQLSGLSDSFIKSAKKTAEEQEKPDQYAIVNSRSSMDPFLTYSDERKLRKQVWENYYYRGDNTDKYDNNALIKEILKLRDERVKLMGYDNFAEWRLQDRMAKNPENAMDLLMAVWPSAIGRVEEEVEDMQKVAKQEGADFEIEAWDYRYYAEKVGKD